MPGGQGYTGSVRHPRVIGTRHVNDPPALMTQLTYINDNVAILILLLSTFAACTLTIDFSHVTAVLGVNMAFKPGNY